MPPPFIYLAGFGLGLLLELAAPSPDLPTWLRIAGGVFGAVAVVVLDTGAMRSFGRHGTPVNPARPAQALVTEGPYRFTRNPMYLGMAYLYAGIALAVEALWPLATLLLVLLVMDRVVIPREEARI